MNVWFIRHGQSVSNEKGLFAGQRENSPLTEMGLAQARAAGEDLRAKGVNVSELFYSPLERTHQTAMEVQKIFQMQDSLLTSDERVIEYDMGEYTNTPIRKIPSVVFTSGKDCENPELFRKRVEAFLRDLIRKPDGDYLIVSHAGVARCIEAMKKGMTPNAFHDLPTYPNAEAILLDLGWL